MEKNPLKEFYFEPTAAISSTSEGKCACCNQEINSFTFFSKWYLNIDHNTNECIEVHICKSCIKKALAAFDEITGKVVSKFYNE